MRPQAELWRQASCQRTKTMITQERVSLAEPADASAQIVEDGAAILDQMVEERCPMRVPDSRRSMGAVV
jgi:hypothetical protein